MNVRFLPLILLVLCTGGAQAQELNTKNVFLITLDGLRWQEFYSGADSLLLHDERWVDEVDALSERFWADSAVERRARLMPFFWSTVAEHGQLYGNRSYGNLVDVSNKHVFSYPGYNEILTGFADEAIDSNAKRPNPNVTLLEWINTQEGFDGLVAAFGSWDVFPYIINEDRSGIVVNAGFEAAEGDISAREAFLNVLQEQTPSPWSTVRLDVFTHHFAKEYLIRERPRLLYIAYGETDDFAHDAEYDSYLESAHRTDAFIEDLWNWVQADDAYRDRTSFVITTDHGRGFKDEWVGHGADWEGSNHIWIAVLGPDSSGLGEVRDTAQLYQNQVAATVVRLLGFEYGNRVAVGPPIESALR